MPYYAKSDVISEQNKKFKLKYFVNKTFGGQKYKRACITVLKVLSHNAIKIFIYFILFILINSPKLHYIDHKIDNIYNSI